MKNKILALTVLLVPTLLALYVCNKPTTTNGNKILKQLEAHQDWESYLTLTHSQTLTHKHTGLRIRIQYQLPFLGWATIHDKHGHDLDDQFTIADRIRIQNVVKPRLDKINQTHDEHKEIIRQQAIKEALK